MKRFICLAMCAVLSIGIVACGPTTESPDTTTNTPVSTTAPAPITTIEDITTEITTAPEPVSSEIETTELTTEPAVTTPEVTTTTPPISKYSIDTALQAVGVHSYDYVSLVCYGPEENDCIRFYTLTNLGDTQALCEEYIFFTTDKAASTYDHPDQIVLSCYALVAQTMTTPVKDINSHPLIQAGNTPYFW